MLQHHPVAPNPNTGTLSQGVCLRQSCSSLFCLTSIAPLGCHSPPRPSPNTVPTAQLYGARNQQNICPPETSDIRYLSALACGGHMFRCRMAQTVREVHCHLPPPKPAPAAAQTCPRPPPNLHMHLHKPAPWGHVAIPWGPVAPVEGTVESRSTGSQGTSVRGVRGFLQGVQGPVGCS